jgi:WD40 repeat protein
VNALDFSPDGSRLAIGGGVPSRSGQIALYSTADGKIEKSFDEVHSDSVLSLQFAPDGKRLVTGSADKFVRLVDLDTGKVVRSFEGHTHHVLGVSIRRDGKVIASAGADNALRFWDAETGERRKTSPTFDREVTGVRYVGNGDTVLVATGDAKVKLYKDAGPEIKSLPGPTDFMYAVAASADGKVLVAGGQDGVFRVWGADGKAAGVFEK